MFLPSFRLVVPFIFLFVTNAFSQKEFRPCRSGELYGFCDENGKVVIPQIYEKTGPFQGNIGPVVREDSFWWFIDKSGNFRFNTRRWSNQAPPQPEKGLYKIKYFDPIFANVTEYYNRNGLPVKVPNEDSLRADTIIYSIFNVQEAIDRARLKLGTPYGLDNLDCSGFIRYIFSPFGINLPYYAREISEAGREIPAAKVKPGDLVFFAGSVATNKTVNHVGMVISVKGTEIEFIHASTSKGVTINKSSDPYYKVRYLYSRRIFG
jgi:cell wall-associated NlpC family hydrolase